jgi:cobaltochelatase CobN
MNFRPVFLAALLVSLLQWALNAQAAPSARVAILEMDINGYQILRAIDALDLPAAIETRFFTLEDLENDPQAQAFVAGSSVVLVNVMMSQLADYMVNHQLVEGRAVYALNQASNPEELARQGFLFDQEIMAYSRHMSVANMVNLERLAVHRHIDKTVRYQPWSPCPRSASTIPMPLAPSPVLPITALGMNSGQDIRRSATGCAAEYSNSLKVGQVEAVDKLIRKLEGAGLSVLPCFGPLQQTLTQYLQPMDGKAPVDLVLAFT